MSWFKLGLYQKVLFIIKFVKCTDQNCIVCMYISSYVLPEGRMQWILDCWCVEVCLLLTLCSRAETSETMNWEPVSSDPKYALWKINHTDQWIQTQGKSLMSLKHIRDSAYCKMMQCTELNINCSLMNL